jgi:hypothetical protein
MIELYKPVKRRTRSPHRRGRRVIVSLLPGDLLAFRDERSRTEFVLPIGAAYDVAVKVHVAAMKAARKAARGRQ